MGSDFNGIVVFGEERAESIASLRRQAAERSESVNIIEWAGRGPIDLPAFEHGRATLSFGGYIPIKWLSQDLQSGWLQHLLQGTGLSFDAMGRPEVRLIGEQTGNGFMLLLHWEDVTSEKVRELILAIGRSYRERAGMTIHFRR